MHNGGLGRSPLLWGCLTVSLLWLLFRFFPFWYSLYVRWADYRCARAQAELLAWGRKEKKKPARKKNPIKEMNEELISEDSSSSGVPSSPPASSPPPKEAHPELVVLKDCKKHNLSRCCLKQVKEVFECDPEVEHDIWPLLKRKPKLQLGLILNRAEVVGGFIYRYMDTSLRIIHVTPSQGLSREQVVFKTVKKLNGLCKNINRVVNLEVIVPFTPNFRSQAALWKSAGFSSSLLNRKLPERPGDLMTLFTKKMRKNERYAYDLARLDLVDWALDTLKARALASPLQTPVLESDDEDDFHIVQEEGQVLFEDQEMSSEHMSRKGENALSAKAEDCDENSGISGEKLEQESDNELTDLDDARAVFESHPPPLYCMEEPCKRMPSTLAPNTDLSSMHTSADEEWNPSVYRSRKFTPFHSSEFKTVFLEALSQ